jgi:hypothetical protein
MLSGKPGRPSGASGNAQRAPQASGQLTSVQEEQAQEPQASDQAGTAPMVTENEPEYLSGEEDYVDSDFEGRDGYRRGVQLPRSQQKQSTARFCGKSVLSHRLNWFCAIAIFPCFQCVVWGFLAYVVHVSFSLCTVSLVVLILGSILLSCLLSLRLLDGCFRCVHLVCRQAFMCLCMHLERSAL